MNETVYDTVYGDVYCSYICGRKPYTNRILGIVIPFICIRNQIWKPYMIAVHCIRLIYTRTVYDAVYGVVNGAVYRLYKKKHIPV